MQTRSTVGQGGLEAFLSRYSHYLILLPGIVMSLLFVLIPLGLMVQMSFFLGKPGGGFEPAFILDNYAKALTSPTFYSILWETFGLSIGAALMTFVFAYPFAYILAFKITSNTVRSYTIALLLVPFLIDWSIRTVAWIPILGQAGIVNSFLQSLGLAQEAVAQLLFTRYTLFIIWLQTYVLFMMFPIYLAMNRIDPDLIRAAQVIKAPPHRVFYDIIFKLSLPGVVAGFIFVFVTTLGDSLTPGLWGGGIQTLGLSVMLYSGNFIWPYASTLSTLLLIVALVVLYILLKIVNIKKLVYEG